MTETDDNRKDGRADGADTQSNDGQRFDRVPETASERVVPERASREEIIDWWQTRFGIRPITFEAYTFWEKGAGKIWAFSGDVSSPIEIEGLGLTFMRTRQEHWKPTTNAVQRFGREASRNVIELDGDSAVRFLAGDDQAIDWDGDWGYLIVTHEYGGESEPIGVGLYVYDELRSVVPKGRQEDLDPV